jgi:hypothetical protein
MKLNNQSTGFGKRHRAGNPAALTLNIMSAI